MSEPRVSIAPKDLVDQEGLPPGVIIVVVEPGATALEATLVEDRTDRQRLEMLRHPKRYRITEVEPEKATLVARLRSRSEKIRKMIAAWGKSR